MADDLRTPPDDTREKIVTEWTPMNETGRRVFLAELDRVDPLRALLADTLQARAFLAEHLAGQDRWAAWAAEERQTWCETRLYRIDPLLAALREVAGL